jgi:hypothetical protein
MDSIPLPDDIIHLIQLFLTNPLLKEILNLPYTTIYTQSNDMLIGQRMIDETFCICTTTITENIERNEIYIITYDYDDNNISYGFMRRYIGKVHLLYPYIRSIHNQCVVPIHVRMNQLNTPLVFNTLSIMIFNKMCSLLTSDQLEQLYRRYILYYN